MKYLFLPFIVLLSLVPKTVFGTHIVGGEFELIHLSAYTYRLNLVLYFDEVNGDPLAKDPYVYPYIFRKSDNELMHSLYLYKQSETDVPYTNPECTYEGLETNKILYSAELSLPPEVYNDPEGYYIIWERCCRNSTISNVVQPIDDTIGQTFYLEFPPTIRNGEQFINSSPVLFPPLSDYACLGVDYYVDFSGTDPDGDSLRYSLVTPLNSSEPIPVPTPKPRGYHSGVPWIAGIDSSNMVPGTPALNIDSNGLLKVTPDRLGLFVFAVLCEEFRDGIKIGEVRRDFQMLVIDCPPQGNAPEIAYKVHDGDDYTNEFQVLGFDNSMEGDDRCIEFIVTDEDVTGIANISLKPLNFKNSPVEVLSIAEEYYSPGGDTLKVKVCFSACPAIEGVHLIDFIGNDNSCPLPKMDTVHLAFTIEPIQNADPEFSLAENYIEEVLFTDSIFSVIIEGTDADNDPVEVTMLPVGFDPANFGISFTEITNKAGFVSTEFSWDLYCNQFEYTSDSVYTIKFLLDDVNICNQGKPDTLIYKFIIDRVENSAPYFLNNTDQHDLVVYGNEPLEIVVKGRDANGDYLWLEFEPTNFWTYNFDITYRETLNEPGQIEAVFNWDLRCDQFYLETDSVFQFEFRITDSPACQLGKSDSLKYSVLVKPPRNAPPIFLEENFKTEQTLLVGDKLKLDIQGRDIDGDQLALVLLESNIDFYANNILYNEVKNEPGAVDARLEWEMNCEHLEITPDKKLEAKFLLYDSNLCIPEEGDTLKISIILSDIKSDLDFLIPNVVTPNGDLKNDYFQMCSDNLCDERYRLPVDNCENKFLGVEIYNRWGRPVYESVERNFKWNPKDFPAGNYYYLLKFTKRDFKGTISVL